MHGAIASHRNTSSCYFYKPRKDGDGQKSSFIKYEHRKLLFFNLFIMIILFQLLHLYNLLHKKLSNMGYNLIYINAYVMFELYISCKLYTA